MTNGVLPLALSQGDPAGIGPETIAMAFRDHPQRMAGCFVVGDVATLIGRDGSAELTVREVARTAEEQQQLMQQYLDQVTGAVDQMTPEDMQRTKDMMSALNEMLNKREQGQDPEFEKFMENFGDFFPENPKTLDELLEIMAKRMANAQAMLNSMTPEQRDQMRQMSVISALDLLRRELLAGPGAAPRQ